MNIQTRAKPLPHLTSTSLSFSYLSFLFGRGPELTGHQHRASFDSFLHKDGRPERRGRRSLRSEFHTQSGYQRPVGKFYSPYGSHNPPVPHLPRAKPGTPSVSQRPVERAQWSYLTSGLSERIGPRPCRATGREVLLDCRQVKPIRHEFGPRHCRVHKKFSILFVQSVIYCYQRAPGMG